MAKNTEALGFLNPDTATSGLFEGPGTVTDAKWEEYDFNGKASPNNGLSGVVMALHFSITPDGEDEPVEQFWPAGPIEHFAPSDDGKSFEATTGKSGFSKQSATIRLVQHLVSKGFPKTRLGNDPTVFIGMKCNWKQVEKENAQPSAGGRAKTELMPVEIITMPGEKAAKGGAKASAGAGAKKGAGAGAGADDAASIAKKFALQVVNAADGAMSAEDISTEAFQAMLQAKVDKGVRKEALELLGDEDFYAQAAEFEVTDDGITAA